MLLLLVFIEDFQSLSSIILLTAESLLINLQQLFLLRVGLEDWYQFHIHLFNMKLQPAVSWFVWAWRLETWGNSKPGSVKVTQSTSEDRAMLDQIFSHSLSGDIRSVFQKKCLCQECKKRAFQTLAPFTPPVWSVNIEYCVSESCWWERSLNLFHNHQQNIPSPWRFTSGLCLTTHPMRTRPRRAKRQDFPSKGGTSFRLWARRTPPGGRPRGWATATCAPPSSLPPSSRRGSQHQLCCEITL